MGGREQAPRAHPPWLFVEGGVESKSGLPCAFPAETMGHRVGQRRVSPSIQPQETKFREMWKRIAMPPRATRMPQQPHEVGSP